MHNEKFDSVRRA